MKIAELISRLDTYERAYNGRELQEALGYNLAYCLDLSDYGYTCQVILEYIHESINHLIGKYLILRDKKPIAILTQPTIGEKNVIQWITVEAYEETKEHIHKLHCPEPPEQKWLDLNKEWEETYKIPSVKNLIAGVHTKAIYLGKECTIEWTNRNFMQQCAMKYPDQVVPLKEILVNNWIPISQLSFPIQLK